MIKVREKYISCLFYYWHALYPNGAVSRGKMVCHYMSGPARIVSFPLSCRVGVGQGQ